MFWDKIMAILTVCTQFVRKHWIALLLVVLGVWLAGSFSEALIVSGKAAWVSPWNLFYYLKDFI